jgi:hypothetical protein
MPVEAEVISAGRPLSPIISAQNSLKLVGASSFQEKGLKIGFGWVGSSTPLALFQVPALPKIVGKKLFYEGGKGAMVSGRSLFRRGF